MAKKKFDDLSIRMKEYEHTFRNRLPKGVPVIIRLDGKGFHNYTKGMKKPFDESLAKAMWETTKFLCKNENIHGCKMGYTQSDEITLLLINYEKRNSAAWFENYIQKMVSVSASMATAKFNEEIHKDYPTKGLAFFDSRVFVLPQHEAINTFINRQQDASKNSISMVAQANFNHHELQGLKGPDMQDKLWKEKGINWNDLPVWQKRGVAVVNKKQPKTVEYKGEKITVMRNAWEVDFETPIFTQDRDYINKYVFPKKEEA